MTPLQDLMPKGWYWRRMDSAPKDKPLILFAGLRGKNPAGQPWAPHITIGWWDESQQAWIALSYSRGDDGRIFFLRAAALDAGAGLSGPARTGADRRAG